MAFAEIALGEFKALRQPATPRNYEIWYTYATGYQPSLNQTINDVLQRRATSRRPTCSRCFSAGKAGPAVLKKTSSSRRFRRRTT